MRNSRIFRACHVDFVVKVSPAKNLRRFLLIHNFQILTRLSDCVRAEDGFCQKRARDYRIKAHNLATSEYIFLPWVCGIKYSLKILAGKGRSSLDINSRKYIALFLFMTEVILTFLRGARYKTLIFQLASGLIFLHNTPHKVLIF